MRDQQAVGAPHHAADGQPFTLKRPGAGDGAYDRQQLHGMLQFAGRDQRRRIKTVITHRLRVRKEMTVRSALSPALIRPTRRPSGKMDADIGARPPAWPETAFIAVDKGGNADKKGDGDPGPIRGHESS